jgi:hypothetical protein
MTDRVSSIGGMTLTGELAEKLVPPTLCPPEISKMDWTGIETGLSQKEDDDEPHELRHETH